MKGMTAIGAITAAALAGCAGGADMHGAAALSTPTIKQDLLTHRNEVWKDSSSIRGARIGQAYSCQQRGDFSGTPMTCICIESNAKNSFGGYTGMQKRVAVYRGSTMVSYQDWDFGDLCDGMEPFPELNGDYVAAVARPKPSARQ